MDLEPEPELPFLGDSGSREKGRLRAATGGSGSATLLITNGTGTGNSDLSTLKLVPVLASIKTYIFSRQAVTLTNS